MGLPALGTGHRLGIQNARAGSPLQITVTWRCVAPGGSDMLNNGDGGNTGGRGVHVASPWQCSSDLVVAVLLFGATRDVTHTHASHARNVIEPLEAYWSGARGGAVGSVVDVFIHAMMMPAVHNPRAGELGKASFRPETFLALGPACRYQAEDQDNVDLFELPKYGVMDGKQAATRNTSDDSSLLMTRANSYRAFYSLHRAAQMARAHELVRRSRYRFVCAVRSDTAVYTSLTPALVELVKLAKTSIANASIVVPNYNHWLGLNDRFAIGHRDVMFDVYAARLLLASEEKLQVMGERGNTESFLCRILKNAKAYVLLMDICVVRVRSNGRCVHSDMIHTVEPERSCLANGIYSQNSRRCCLAEDGSYLVWDAPS